jgi:hypothetical protein
MERSVVSRLRQRPLLVVGALVLLLVAVAIASTGSVPTGSSGSGRPAERLLDVFVSLMVLVMLAGIGIWIYALWVRKNLPLDDRLLLRARRRRTSWFSLLALIGAVAVLVRWGSLDSRLRNRFGGGAGGTGSAGSGGKSSSDTYTPHFATAPFLIVVALLAAAAGAWYLSQRRRRPGSSAETADVLPVLADVLEETLDDVRAEPDPRRAVIASYARMERALAAYGLPRRPAEAPDEYLRRILADLDVGRRPSERLTALYAWAKFSQHDVGPEMKEEAIDALEDVRGELRAAEALAEEQRRRRAELRERAS